MDEVSGEFEIPTLALRPRGAAWRFRRFLRHHPRVGTAAFCVLCVVTWAGVGLVAQQRSHDARGFHLPALLR